MVLHILRPSTQGIFQLGQLPGPSSKEGAFILVNAYIEKLEIEDHLDKSAAVKSV